MPPTMRQPLSVTWCSGLRYYRANVLNGLGGPGVSVYGAVPALQLVPTMDPAIRGDSYAETPMWAERVERRDLSAGSSVVAEPPGGGRRGDREVHPLDRLRTAVHA